MNRSEIIDAIDDCQHAQKQAEWLAALMRAIQLDAKHNKGFNVDSLAGLGRYLADDCVNFFDGRVGELQNTKEDGGVK